MLQHWAHNSKSCLLTFKLPLCIRALWFVLEIIMAKNENNSHAFIRKMVENIKQTKDAQAPTDPKTNEVHIIKFILPSFIIYGQYM